MILPSSTRSGSSKSLILRIRADPNQDQDSDPYTTRSFSWRKFVLTVQKKSIIIRIRECTESKQFNDKILRIEVDQSNMFM